MSLIRALIGEFWTCVVRNIYLNKNPHYVCEARFAKW